MELRCMCTCVQHDWVLTQRCQKRSGGAYWWRTIVQYPTASHILPTQKTVCEHTPNLSGSIHLLLYKCTRAYTSTDLHRPTMKVVLFCTRDACYLIHTIQITWNVILTTVILTSTVVECGDNLCATLPLARLQSQSELGEPPTTHEMSLLGRFGGRVAKVICAHNGGTTATG